MINLDGLWSENPALVQLLGLCPLLAVSTSTVTGLGLGLATTATLIVANVLASAVRKVVPDSVRLPAFVAIIASVVTALDLVGPALFFELHRELGLFVPLIVTNCVVLARVEAYGSRQPLPAAALDGLVMGLGFAGALVVLGVGRELIGTGCLLVGMDMFLPVGGAGLCLISGGLPIALTPPGAFFGLALLVVAHRFVQRRVRGLDDAVVEPPGEGVLNKHSRAEMFRRFEQANPEPTTELDYASPFELLVAVILSAQATDKSVNLATRGLFAEASTPARMLALGEEGIRRHVRSIGLFNTKSANIAKTCAILVDEYAGEVPRDREALQALPGVGRKTANVILNTAFGEETMAVDTHIFRLSNRTGLAPGKTVRAVEDKLLKVIPKPYRRNAHHWLILHGRYVCTARRPRCPECTVRDLCDYRSKTPPAADSEPAP